MKYIFIYLLFILPLNAGISSVCLDIEKKYYTTEPKIKNCYITEFTEDEDKTQCIKNDYNRFNTDIDILFRKLHPQSKEIKLNPKNSGIFCNTFINRINAIFREDNDKEKELQKVFAESKRNYQEKLLASLSIKKRDVPKKCFPKLKLFLKSQLEGGSLIELTKGRYYSCMARTRSFEPITNSTKEEQPTTSSVVLPFGLSKHTNSSDIEKSINTNLTDIPKPIVGGAETISEDSYTYTSPKEVAEIHTPLESNIQLDNQLINNVSEPIYQENSIHLITQPDTQGDDFIEPVDTETEYQEERDTFSEPVKNLNTFQIKRDTSKGYYLSKYAVKKKRFINYVEELIVTINTTVNLIEDVKMK